MTPPTPKIKVTLPIKVTLIKVTLLIEEGGIEDFIDWLCPPDGLKPSIRAFNLERIVPEGNWFREQVEKRFAEMHTRPAVPPITTTTPRWENT